MMFQISFHSKRPPRSACNAARMIVICLASVGTPLAIDAQSAALLKTIVLSSPTTVHERHRAPVPRMKAVLAELRDSHERETARAKTGQAGAQRAGKPRK
jgi:hypothetical protein